MVCLQNNDLLCYIEVPLGRFLLKFRVTTTSAKITLLLLSHTTILKQLFHCIPMLLNIYFYLKRTEIFKLFKCFGNYNNNNNNNNNTNSYKKSFYYYRGNFFISPFKRIFILVDILFFYCF